MTAASRRLAALISQTDYEAAHAELRQILGMAPERRDDARVRALGLIIDDYERRHFPVDPPSLAGAVLARMDDYDLSVADLAERSGAAPWQIEQLVQGDLTVPLVTVLAVADVLALPAEVIRGAARAGGAAAEASRSSPGSDLLAF